MLQMFWLNAHGLKFWILKLLNLKLIIELELQRIIIYLVKVSLKVGQDKYLLSILFWRLKTYKLKDLNGEKIIIPV